MWTQVVGKTRMAFEPLQNHWWNVPLYVTPVGLTTLAIPYRGRTFSVEFDFVLHRLRMQTNSGNEHTLCLYPRSVADFYKEYVSALKQLGIEVRINRTPAEFDDLTPYDEDEHHDSYDRGKVEQFHDVLRRMDRLFKRFRTRFLGKCSPVHFFWGSFDLAVTRFSGRPAPVNPSADSITREGYSMEVSSCGFWPGDRRFPEAALYSYAAPSPEGLSGRTILPRDAYWDTGLNEFILKYQDARRAASPEADVLAFCQSSYEAAADLAHWDRSTLERQST